MKVGGSRPAVAGLWRVFEMRDFQFMGEMVTGRVGHLRTYGPRVQVEGGRWPSVVPRLRDYGGVEGVNGGKGLMD